MKRASSEEGENKVLLQLVQESDDCRLDQVRSSLPESPGPIEAILTIASRQKIRLEQVWQAGVWYSRGRSFPRSMVGTIAGLGTVLGGVEVDDTLERRY